MTAQIFTVHRFDGTDWQGALEALDAGATFGGSGALQQSARYGDLAQALGRKVVRLELHVQGRCIARVQMVARARLWLITRGPVFAPGVGRDLQRRALRHLARRFGLVIATPETPLSGVGLVPLVTARHRAIWSLAPAPEALRAGLAGKWRNRLVAAERAGLEVHGASDFDWILRRDQAQQRARGYRALPAGFTRAWGAGAGRDGVLALRVQDRSGQPLAGLIVLRHGRGASYHIGWSGPEGRKTGAHNIGLWAAALRLREGGCTRFDLGDVDSETGAGRMRFKLGTGAQLCRLGATLWVLPNWQERA